MKAVRSPLLLKLLLLFVFFLPFRSVQIPLNVIGFEINPARIASVLFTVLLFLSIGLDLRSLHIFTRRGVERNPYVFYLVIYFLLSILYYYVLVGLGKTILFGGDGAGFLQDWRGRPFAQLAAFGTYGIIPFYLTQYFGQYERMRQSIERTFLWAILILVYFGLVQVVAYGMFKNPLVGRNIFELHRDLGSVHIFGLSLYRVNSLAGEPRDFGSLLVGAIPFYLYAHSKSSRRFIAMNLVLMVVAFLLTTSTSALLTAAISLVVTLFDTLSRKKIRLRVKYIRYAFAGALLGFGLLYTRIIGALTLRTTMIVNAITTQLQSGQVQPLAQAQTFNLVILYYFLHLFDIPPMYILFGSGYSNFITPLVGLLRQYFHYTVEAAVLTPDAFSIKLFVEGGVVGMCIYGAMFFYTLRLNGRLLFIFQKRNDRLGYRKALWLRFAFIAFFISGATQISYYYFIMMGLIIGWLNAETVRNTPVPAPAAVPAAL